METEKKNVITGEMEYKIEQLKFAKLLDDTFVERLVFSPEITKQEVSEVEKLKKLFKYELQCYFATRLVRTELITHEVVLTRPKFTDWLFRKQKKITMHCEMNISDCLIDPPKILTNRNMRMVEFNFKTMEIQKVGKDHA